MEFTRKYPLMEWEEHWEREKEHRKQMIEEGGEKFEEEKRKLKWIMSYNDSKIGIIKKEKGKEKEQEIIQRYHRQSYLEEIFHTLEEMRVKNVLTDLILSTEDGLTIHVHSLVLAAVSSLIQQKIQKRCRGEREMFLRLAPEVHGLGLVAVVEFAYTGVITTTSKDKAQIQTTAQSLGAPRILELLKVEKEIQKGNKEKQKTSSAEDQMKVSLQSINQLLAERVGCDVELVVEGIVFNAHRVLLTASSNYFRGMFTTGMRESQQESVSLLLVRAAEFEDLLHCAYTGTLALGWNCVFEFTCASIQFQFEPALSLCLNFLQREIDVQNCLDVASFADAYGMADLKELADDFALRHFQELSATPKFQDLSAERLIEFLQSNALSAPSELTVFRAVVAWVEADPARRLPHSEKLMSAVRFSFMTFKEFREVRAVNMSMECSGGDKVELYKSALKEFVCGDSNSVAQQHRVRYPKDALVLVGGDQLHPDTGQRLPSKQLWFANSLRNGTGLVKEIEWRMLGEMPDLARFRHSVGVLGGKLYLAGGCHFYAKADTLKSFFRFDPVRDSWERLADMVEQRSNFTLVVSENVLYSIGGDKDINTNLDSVEQYSTKSDFWSLTHPLDQALSGHAATVWGGEIFISGGFNSKYQCLATMFLYHPARGTTYLAEMTNDRAQHCIEGLKKHLYVAGGVCNLRKFYTDQMSCEMYDPTHDIWTVFAPLSIPHVGAASAVLEERLYILGGYCQEDYNEVRLAHRYDPVTQRWETMGKMLGPVTDTRACLLHLPTYIRKKECG
ncbi:kelch-like protein 33 [Triplophysa rosa]|uniref:Kelch-like protein 33 n=1 Tax=Triplophysa rosa TaxID=992332 RepID=A0A9W7T5F6_TRIRA|nr:kelch-like protein 33 [Triplophysa rosa]KAI7790074.1 putative kelch-like protein 33 [Triplophysa rosa]